MSRLLNAGFKRLIKDKVFWICIIAFITLGITRCWAQYNEIIKYNAIVKIDNIIFNSIVIIDFAIPIFICLFVGTDYSDGTIRNKIIAGHTKKSIYFSNLLISIAAGIIINSIFMIVVAAIGIPLFGPSELEVSTFLWLMLDITFIIIVYCSIFNMISLICSNKTISVVISILLVLGLFIINMIVLNKLQEPEYIPQIVIENGVAVETGKEMLVKNPHYLDANTKKVYQFIADLNPTSQGFQISGLFASNIKILAVYSFIISLITNSIGYFIFNKKDLK